MNYKAYKATGVMVSLFFSFVLKKKKEFVSVCMIIVFNTYVVQHSWLHLLCEYVHRPQ